MYKILNKTENKQVQTERNDYITFIQNSFSNHLSFAGQSYFTHFRDSMKYCGKSVKASM